MGTTAQLLLSKMGQSIANTSSLICGCFPRSNLSETLPLEKGDGGMLCLKIPSNT